MRSLYYAKNNKINYDGKKISHYLSDEYGQMKIYDGKSLKIGKLFYMYREKTMFWFRVFGGYGLHFNKGYFLTFSERNKLAKKFVLFGWRIKILKPFKL